MLKKFITLLMSVSIMFCLSACKNVGNYNTEEVIAKEVTAEEAATRYLQGCVTFDYDKIDQYGILDHKTDTLICVDVFLEMGEEELDGKTYKFNRQADVFAFWSELDGYDQICKNYDEFRMEEIKWMKNYAEESVGKYSVDFKVHNVTEMTPGEISSFIEEQEVNWEQKRTSMELENIIDFSQVEEYKKVYFDITLDSEKYGHAEFLSDDGEFKDGLSVVKINNHWKVVNLDTYLILQFNLQDR